jgi:hypothetical protein
MTSRRLRSSLAIVSIIPFSVLVFLFGEFSGSALGQESARKATYSASEAGVGDRPYLRDQLGWNWNQQRAECASGGVGGGAAVSGLPSENGGAGRARGGECKVNTPNYGGLGLRGVGAAGAGSTGFRCYGRWIAGLQLGLGTRYFSADRSGRQHGKHGAFGRRVWRTLEIHERGQSEFESRIGHMAGFD